MQVCVCVEPLYYMCVDVWWSSATTVYAWVTALDWQLSVGIVILCWESPHIFGAAAGEGDLQARSSRTHIGHEVGSLSIVCFNSCLCIRLEKVMHH